MAPGWRKGVQMRDKFIKKEELKVRAKDVIVVVLAWLFALSLLYIVYLKIRMFYH
jgi:hypothetical protein